MQTLTYSQWMSAVDKIIDERIGLGLDMLPDWLSRDAYENGLTPDQGAQECLDSAGWYDEMLVDDL